LVYVPFGHEQFVDLFVLRVSVTVRCAGSGRDWLQGGVPGEGLTLGSNAQQRG
jgi:hypothetical protein